MAKKVKKKGYKKWLCLFVIIFFMYASYAFGTSDFVFSRAWSVKNSLENQGYEVIRVNYLNFIPNPPIRVSVKMIMSSDREKQAMDGFVALYGKYPDAENYTVTLMPQDAPKGTKGCDYSINEEEFIAWQKSLVGEKFYSATGKELNSSELYSMCLNDIRMYDSICQNN